MYASTEPSIPPPSALHRYLTLSSLALVAAAFCEVNVPHYSSKYVHRHNTTNHHQSPSKVI